LILEDEADRLSETSVITNPRYVTSQYSQDLTHQFAPYSYHRV